MTKQDDRVNTTSTKTPNAGGAPLGNQNHLTHGVSKLEAERKRGRIDRRTTPYRAMKKLERSVESNFTESRKKWHRQSIARGQYYVKLVHEHVLTLKHVTRKGRVHVLQRINYRAEEIARRDNLDLKQPSDLVSAYSRVCNEDPGIL